MPGTDGGGGTLDGGRPGELMPDRKASSCVLGDEGTTTKIANIKLISCVLTVWLKHNVALTRKLL